MVDAEQNEYEGEWEAGRRSGHGVCRYCTGDVYDGQWHADMRHGRGTCTYSTGDKYEGQWHEDMREGQGSAALPLPPLPPHVCRSPRLKVPLYAILWWHAFQCRLYCHKHFFDAGRNC